MILPANLDVEKLILAMPMINAGFWETHASQIHIDDFSTESHRRIWRAMGMLADQQRHIDRISVAAALQEANWFDSVGGFSYLISLDDGMPQISNMDGYVRILLEVSARRRILHLADALYRKAQDASFESSDLIANTTAELSAIGKRGVGGREYVSAEEYIDEYELGFDRLISPNAFPESVGIRTEWPSFNRMIGGFQPGELIILAARPSMGKSAMLLQIMAHAAVFHRKVVGSISLEMEPPAQIRRITAQLAKVDATDMKYGRLNHDDRGKMLHAVRQLTQSGIHFDVAHQDDHKTIAAAALRLQSTHGLDMLGIDHLHLTDGPEREARTQIRNFMRATKRLAKQLKIPIILLAQLSRKCEERTDKRPMLSDLREDGSIEQDADIVLFIYRAEVYEKNRPDLVGEAELDIAKHREGPTGKVNLVWLPHFQRFEEREYD